MKQRSLFFIVMMSVQIIFFQMFVGGLLFFFEKKESEISSNPFFQGGDMDISGIGLGTLVFLGVGLMLIPVIRRSILAKLVV